VSGRSELGFWRWEDRVLERARVDSMILESVSEMFQFETGVMSELEWEEPRVG
jgi:hypothetical protein